MSLLVHWTWMREESISELEDIQREVLKTEKQREQRLKKKNKISKGCETTTKSVT